MKKLPCGEVTGNPYIMSMIIECIFQFPIFLTAFTILWFWISEIATLSVYSEMKLESTVLAVLFAASRFEVEFGLRRWAKKHESTACSGNNRLLLSV